MPAARRALSPRRTILYLYLGVFLLALAPRLAGIESRGIWTDEDTQFLHAQAGPFGPDLVSRAAEQQQPPLDYLLQSIFIRNFGLREAGLRLHAAVVGAAAAVFFCALLRGLLRSPWAVAVGTIAFVFNPWLIRYAQEGRPYSMAVLAVVLHLLLLAKLFCAPGDEGDPRSTVRRIGLLTGVHTGFLLAIGFQPFVFLLVSCISLAPLLAVKSHRSRVGLVYASCAIAVLISFPITWIVVRRGGNWLNELGFGEAAGPLFEVVSGLSLSALAPYWWSQLGSYAPFCLGALLITGGVAVFSRRDRPAFFPMGYLAIAVCAYPLVHQIAFELLVDWRLKERYFLTLTPVLIAAMAVAADVSFDWVERVPGARSRGLRTAGYAVALLLFAQGFAADAAKDRLLRHATGIHREWRQLYEWFARGAPEGSDAYLMNLVRVDRYSPGWKGHRVYYPREAMPPVALRTVENLYEDLVSGSAWRGQGNVYLVTAFGDRKIREQVEGPWEESVRVWHVPGLSVIELRRGTGARRRLTSTLHKLKNGLPMEEANWKIHQLVIGIDIGMGRSRRAQRNLQILESLDERGALLETTTRLHQELRAAIRRRAATGATGPLPATLGRPQQIQ